MTTFGLVAIVKDEAARIGPCLESLRPLISSWTILDTGSTDGTQELVRTALAGIPGHLHAGPFENFGSARSRAFALARYTAEWLLATDADMTWSIDDGWEPDPAVDAYLVDMGGEGFTNRLPLVLRGDRAWESRGPVHEYTVLSSGSLGRREATDAVRIVQPGAAWSTERGRWHAELLEAELAAHPGDPRSTFYLAQTRRDLGELDEARRLYRERVALGDAPEEQFVAAWQAARLEPDWRIRHVALLGAWEMRPWRLEPLYEVVRELNQREAHHAAYALASAPIEPSGDGLFVETAARAWGLAFERSIAAWHLGLTDVFTELSEQLLANPRLPDPVRAAVERNRSLREVA